MAASVLRLHASVRLTPKGSVEAKKSEAAPKPAAEVVAQPAEKKYVSNIQLRRRGWPLQLPRADRELSARLKIPHKVLEQVELKPRRRQDRSAVPRKMEVTNFLFGQRTGFLGAAQAKLQENPEWRPVCEEQFDIDREAPQ